MKKTQRTSIQIIISIKWPIKLYFWCFFLDILKYYPSLYSLISFLYVCKGTNLNLNLNHNTFSNLVPIPSNVLTVDVSGNCVDGEAVVSEA